MSWLLRDGDVLATIDQATARTDRLRGMWHRPPPTGALLLVPPVVLHTVGLSYAVDVAFCDGGTDGRMAVTETVRLSPCRVARPRIGTKMLVVAPDGSFERWRLVVGDELEVSGPGSRADDGDRGGGGGGGGGDRGNGDRGNGGGDRRS